MPRWMASQITSSLEMAGTHQANSADQEGNGGAVRRDDPIKAYEKELTSAWRWALIVSSFHAFSRFVSKCNLICATVVIMGAFADTLQQTDFNCVGVFLLLDGVRLAFASFFSRMLGRALAYLSQDPRSINHRQDEQYTRAWWARSLSLSLQMVLCVAAGVCLICSKYTYIFSTEGADVYYKSPNLQVSLHIFYTSVFLNYCLAFITLVLSAIASLAALRRSFPTEQSILRYYDKLLENAMASGVLMGDEFVFLRFAFEMLASEFSRNVQPEAVAKNHKQLIHYMYAHRVGVDFVQTYILNAEDTYLQLAAVNVVGFWADRTWKVGVPNLRLPEDLMTKLADKVGTGQVGWAATSSCGAIAASSPNGAQMVERTCTSKGVHLVNHLAHLIDDSSSRSLSFVRTLVLFYEQLCVGQDTPPTPFERSAELTNKLQKLAMTVDRHRLRVQAAYLLFLMKEACDVGDAGYILRIDPAQDNYWFRSEVLMLQFLRRATDNDPFEFSDYPIKDDHNRILLPTWWAGVH